MILNFFIAMLLEQKVYLIFHSKKNFLKKYFQNIYETESTKSELNNILLKMDEDIIMLCVH